MCCVLLLAPSLFLFRLSTFVEVQMFSCGGTFFPCQYKFLKMSALAIKSVFRVFFVTMTDQDEIG